jgi:predicted Ser/Thr protein kinase
MFGDLLKAVRDNKIGSYNDMVNFVYDRGYEGNSAAKIINYLSRKIPNVVGVRR